MSLFGRLPVLSKVSKRRKGGRRKSPLPRCLITCLVIALCFYLRPEALRFKLTLRSARETLKTPCYKELDGSEELVRWQCETDVGEIETGDRVRAPLHTREVKRVAVISTYPPTKCGVATYAAHLYEAMEAAFERSGVSVKMDVLAVDPSPADLPAPNYPPRVVRSWKKNNFASYKETGKWLAAEDYDVVLAHFEYGLYGGLYGSYFLTLLQEIADTTRIQLITHTIEPDMDIQKKWMLEELVKRSDEFIGLSIPMCNLMDRALQGLSNRHQVQPKCAMMPHGAPKLLPDGEALMTVKHKARAKKDISTDWIVMLSSGLLNLHKGFEVIVEALPDIVAANPKVHYLVVGQNHPECECDYVGILKKLAYEKGVSDHVHFDSEYQTDAALHDYFVAADFVVAPYGYYGQTSSGTVPLAMAAGAIAVTSPFLHGISLLSHGRGLIVNMTRMENVVDAITGIVSSPEKMLEMAEKAREYSRTFTWDVVGQAHAFAITKPLPSDQVGEAPDFRKSTASKFVVQDDRYVMNTDHVTDVDVAISIPQLRLLHDHVFRVAGCYINIKGPYWRHAELRSGTGKNYTSWYSKSNRNKYYISEQYYVKWASKTEPAVSLVLSVQMNADGTVEVKMKGIPLLDDVKVSGIVLGLRYMSNPDVVHYKQYRGRVVLEQGTPVPSIVGPVAIARKGKGKEWPMEQNQLVISGFQGAGGADCALWRIGQAEVLDGKRQMHNAAEVKAVCEGPCRGWAVDIVDYVAVKHTVPDSSVPVIATHSFYVTNELCPWAKEMVE